MSRLTKVLLELTIANTVMAVLFVPDIIDVSSVPSLYVTFPLAVIFFCSFLIALALEKEVAMFDAEQREHQRHAAPNDRPESADSFHGHTDHEPMRA
ncbi:MAG: hypothetical protein HY298_22050 [Verrucomicrobia bacterium]|nr:hypothetical protein [Verrucomicrobiota bacterium]